MAKVIKKTLKTQMIEEAILILATVSWCEKQINNIILQIDKEDAKETPDYEKLEKLKDEINLILNKIHKEEENMNLYLSKYSKLINEKEKVISVIRKKK